MNEKLDNAYVREYYDAQVGQLASYTEDRWHSSPVRSFEFNQTKRAIEGALDGREYRTALEIGPGDAVWTRLIRAHVSERMHLVEQSREMLGQAKERLAGVEGVTFEHADFSASNPPGGNDLIIAIRCFEYFEDKQGALRKMRDLLSPGGRIIIVTKNAKLVTSVPANRKLLHTDQVSKASMQRLARESGLHIEYAYPAVLRWKAAYPPMRVLFDILHRLAVWSRGLLSVPVLDTYAAESYVFVMRIS